uniref:Uncharacterized protein n=1 Tax=Rousettus aegyptiacus TaxID=9407 RepID=A0A7J8C2S7_ROUAE|nr:hypothetical protein HJG63_009429 [Rousettus aegyptiacus]
MINMRIQLSLPESSCDRTWRQGRCPRCSGPLLDHCPSLPPLEPLVLKLVPRTTPSAATFWCSRPPTPHFLEDFGTSPPSTAPVMLRGDSNARMDSPSHTPATCCLSFSYFSKSQGTANLLSVSVDLPFLATPYKWDRMICDRFT